MSVVNSIFTWSGLEQMRLSTFRAKIYYFFCEKLISRENEMDEESLADGEVVKFEGKNWAGGPTVCLDWLTERQIHTHRECVCVRVCVCVCV